MNALFAMQVPQLAEQLKPYVEEWVADAAFCRR